MTNRVALGGKELYPDLSCAGAIKLTEIDTLPCAQVQGTSGNRECLRTAHKSGFYMGGSVSFGVAVSPMPGHESIQTIYYILSHRGVGIFIHGYPSCCMRHKDITQPLLYPGTLHYIFYQACDIYELRPLATLE